MPATHRLGNLHLRVLSDGVYYQDAGAVFGIVPRIMWERLGFEMNARYQMALGLMHACRELGLSIPGDMSIVGFDDIPEAAHFAPPLTTIRQNFSEIGRRAVSLLLGELRGETQLNHDQIVPELIVRESTARA